MKVGDLVRKWATGQVGVILEIEDVAIKTTFGWIHCWHLEVLQ